MIYIIYLVGIVLRFINIDTRPLDGDEGIVAKMIYDNSWQFAISEIARDVHPPLYYLLTKLSLSIFGVSEFSLRLVSAISGILLVVAVYYFAKEFLNKKIALVSSLIVAISAYLIYFSQEARMYSLFALLAVLSYYFFLKYLKKDKLVYLVFYILSTVLLIYTQYLGFVIIFSQLLLFFIDFKNNQKFLFKILISWGLILILFIPQLGTFYNQFLGRTSENISISFSLKEKISNFIGAFYRFSASRIFLDLNPSGIKKLLISSPIDFLIFTISLLVPLYLLIIGLIESFKKYRQFFYFFIIISILPILLILVSSEIAHAANRYLIFLSPFYFILIAIGVLLTWKGYKKIIVILYFFILLFGLYNYYFLEIKLQGSNSVANYLSKKYSPNDIVLIKGSYGGGDEWVFNYYWKSLIDKMPINTEDFYKTYSVGNFQEITKKDVENKITSLLKTYDRVWFFDFSYQTTSINNSKTYNLGKDKEQKDVILWEVTK